MLFQLSGYSVRQPSCLLQPRPWKAFVTGNPDGGSRNIASRETTEPDDVTYYFPAWKMVFQCGKWFSSVENGFPAWKMIFQRGKWFFRLENDFSAWKMVFPPEKSLRSGLFPASRANNPF